MYEFSYRPIDDLWDIRVGERAVTIEVDTRQRMVQGNVVIRDRFKTQLFAERATKIRSKFRKK